LLKEFQLKLQYIQQLAIILWHKLTTATSFFQAPRLCCDCHHTCSCDPSRNRFWSKVTGNPPTAELTFPNVPHLNRMEIVRDTH
jgi:hypothetical protein